MLTSHNLNSHIIISNDIDYEIQKLKEQLKGYRVVDFIRDEFKIEDAKNVISEAYVSESTLKFIILGAKSFNNISQNSLLKVLEEPPLNIMFIIITPSKSALLPTIRSRLPIKKGKTDIKRLELDINLSRLDYKDIFSFLKEYSKVKKHEAKELVEALYFRATITDKLILSDMQLENFDTAYRLLELNSRPQSVFAMLLMGFEN